MKTIKPITIHIGTVLLFVFIILNASTNNVQTIAATLVATSSVIPLPIIRFSQPVIALQWSPDGERLAVANLDSADISILDSRNLIVENIFRFPVSRPIDYEIDSITWCSNGQFIATVLRTEHVINVWDVRNASTAPYLSIMGGQKHVDLTWSPDCKNLAVLAFADDSSEISIWDISTKKILKTFSQTEPAIIWLSWSPNGKYIATETHIEGDPIAEIQLRNPTTFQIVKDFSIDGKKGFTPSFARFVWNPDGSKLAGCSVGNAYKACTLWVWNVEDNQLSKPFEFLVTGQNKFLLWSPNGKSLIVDVGVNSFAVLDIISGQIKQKEVIDSNQINAIDINSARSQVAVADGTGQITIYSLQN